MNFLLLSSTKVRNRIKNNLQKNGIETSFFWKPMHLQRQIKKNFYFDNMEITNNIWKNILILPSSIGLKQKEIFKICKIINNT